MDLIPLIRRLAALAVIVVSFAVSAAAAEQPAEFSGAYGGELIWEGTVVMTGDVLILKGGSLIIRPGTEVRIIPAEGTQIDPEYLSSQTELLIRGTIDIQGTQEKPVRFRIVERPELDDYPWAGITLDGARESRIVAAEIDRADIGIRVVRSSPVIIGNQIVGCRYGIVAQAGSHPKILDNRLENGEGGIFCWRDSRPYLKGNQVTGHDEEGVFVDASSRPWLDRNRVSGNDIGLAFYGGDLPFDVEEITGNRENVRILGGQGQ